MRREDLPQNIGEYRPQSHLAAGGMGRVFLALAPDGGTVAVKQLHPSISYDRKMRERLSREVQVMRRVSSPRVAELLDADLDADPPYIVTRYVQGRTLHDVVKTDGPLRGDDLMKMARGIAEALVAIHGAGHIHRDLKPSNVMVVGGEPVVIDFGIAQEQDATRITREGGAIGTVGYIPPEALEGGAAGPPADVFAWGATIGYAATGKPVFGTGGMQAVALRAYQGAADLDGVPAAFRPLLAASLAPRPDVRPDARTLVQTLSGPEGPAAFSVDPATAQPVQASALAPATDPAAQAAAAKRTRTLAVVASTLAVVVVIGGSLLIRQLRLDENGRPSAQQTPVAAPSHPSYREAIANWGPGKEFTQFLRSSIGKKIFIGAQLDEDILPEDGNGQPFHASRKNDGSSIMVWTECFEKLDPGEQPSYYKCTGAQVGILGEQPGWAGMNWAHGMYSIQGNFEVAGGTVHQGIVSYTLKPTAAA
ncbi:serine/threonine-protein kinase [Actinomadura sp. GTD37]